jgi:predicted acyltransferase
MIAVGRLAGATQPGQRLELEICPPEAALPRARTAPVTRRLQFVDACRGLAVVGMLVANLLNVFLRRVPSPLAHNQGDTLRFFDFPAPLFQFLVGVSLPLFLRHRAAHGRTAFQARLDALRRFTLLVLLGVLLDGVGALSLVPRWGVLQTLGLGGVVATLLDGAPGAVGIAVALALLAVFSGVANGPVHGNPVAAFAFVPLTLAGLIASRGIRRGATARRLAHRAALLSVVTLALGQALFASGVPFNKILGTSSFVALATGMSAAALGGTAWLEAAGTEFPAWLLSLGRNALTTWVMLYVLVYYPAWLIVPTWHRLTFWPGGLAVLGATAALCAGSTALGRRGIRIAL